MSIYLDHNATTPLDPRVLEAMMPYMQGIHGNPSSVHRYGRLVRGAIDQAREQVAELVGAHPSEVIFTSSGTEANNLVLKSVQPQRKSNDSSGTVLVGATEHASLLDPAHGLKVEGYAIQELPCLPSGVYSASELDKALTPSTALVSLMMANNETGVIQPIQELAQVCREANVVVHTDASQAAGKIPVDFTEMNVHFMTLSSHKLYGPLGAGGLITDKSTTLNPQILGGGQEKGMRSGTENVAAIVGFGMAAALAKAELAQRTKHCLALRQRLEQGLKQFDAAIIFGEHAPRLPNTVQFGLVGFHGEATLMKLDCKGIAVSSGSACHADRVDPSHVLLAMGVDAPTALTAIRASLGKDTTEQEVDKLISAVGEIVSDPLLSAAVAANLA